MILVQNYYKDKNPLRHLEIEKCLKENVNNHHIRKILLLIDTDVVPDTISKKIELRRVENRPTYTELFTAANEVALPDEVAIISNSDIYFDNTLGLAENIPADECYALSRWDMVRGELKPFHHSDSQDVWIMRTPIKEVESDFTMGKPGCCSGDSMVSCEVEWMVYQVSLSELFDNFNSLRFRELGLDVRIRSYDLATNEIKKNKVVAVTKSGVKEVWQIFLDSGFNLTATSDHPVLSSDNKFIPLGELKVGDSVVSMIGDGKVTSINSVGETMTYDITMEAPLSNFECNGVFVHNCDNKIAHLLNEAGYKLTNPCKTILAIHLHEGGEHNYTAKDRVPPPYLRVIPQ